MSTARPRRPAAKKRSATTPASGRGTAPRGRLHLHVENVSALGPVFEASRERVREALARHPGLRGRVRVTIGYDGDVFEREIRSTDVLFCWQVPQRETLAGRAPRLRWVHLHGAGVSHVMPLDWLPPGAVLTNSRGIHGQRATEYGFMAILMLNNRIPEMLTDQRRKQWKQLFNSSVEGKTLLVLGVGHIGGGIAQWARRAGMYVIGIRRSGRSHRQVHEMHLPAALHELLPRADFVLVSAPHTTETHHLIGKAELERLKPGAGLVNYSRANLVDYEALRRKLRRREMSAVLDVFDPEPLPPSSPLWDTPNLVITTHSSSDDTDAYTPRTLDLVFDNMERFLDGRPLRNRVSRTRQY